MEDTLRSFDLWIFFFALLGIALACVELNVLWNEDHYEPTSFTWFIKSLVTCTTMVLLTLVYMYYDLLFKWSKLRGSSLPKDTMWSSGLFTEMTTIMFFCLLHPMPGVYFDIPVSAIDDSTTTRTAVYSSDSIFTCLMLLRLTLIFRLLRDHCGVITDSARVFASINQVRLDTWFCIKYIFNKTPVYALAVTLLVSLLSLAFLMREFEKPLNEDLRTYGNCCWLMLVTMTTVGYGDMYPITTLGRMCAIVACLTGIILVSMAVVAIGKTFEMRGTKKTAITRIIRSSYHEQYRDSSAQLITRFFRTMSRAGYQPCTRYNDFVDLYLQRNLKDLSDRPRLVQDARRQWEKNYKLSTSSRAQRTNSSGTVITHGHPGVLPSLGRDREVRGSYPLDIRPKREDDAQKRRDDLAYFFKARDGEMRDGESEDALIFGSAARGIKRTNALHFFRCIDAEFCASVRLQRSIKQTKALNDMTDLNYILCLAQSKLVHMQDKVVEMHFRWQNHLNAIMAKLGIADDAQHHEEDRSGVYVRGRRQSMSALAMGHG